MRRAFALAGSNPARGTIFNLTTFYMSKFQSTISTLAALASIAVTTVGIYKAADGVKQHSLNQQKQIEQLKVELDKKTKTSLLTVQQVPTPVTLPPPQLTPSVSESVETPPPSALPIRQ